MRRRQKPSARELKDHHLWVEVTRTVHPLHPHAASHAPAPTRTTPQKSGATAPKTPMPAAKPVSGAMISANRAPTNPPHHTGGRANIHTSDAQIGPLEPKLKRRVVRGRLPIDATLDLHGMRQSEAHMALNRFVAARHARGDRTLLIITGKGLKSTRTGQIEQRGVLRLMVPQWLARPELAPLVAGWEVSAQTHGGEGAFYLRLKRVRAHRK